MPVIERMVESVESVIGIADVKRSRVRAIGIGSPGPLDPVNGVIIDTPNLPGWTNVPLAKLIEEKTGIPTFVENDVNAGTYGEFALGAGRGKRDVIGIFVGTGIGGGLICDGKLRSGFRHNAGELGHVVLMVDGPYCGCGKKGCLEALASRTAIVRDIRAGIAAGRKSIVPELMKERGRITSSVLSKAVEAGDALAVEVMAQAQYYLGVYVGSAVNFYDPEAVVLGGGVIEAMGEAFLEPIRKVARQYFISQQDADKVEIVAAKLGDYAGVLGAAMLGQERARAA
jgi:glucokinase